MKTLQSAFIAGSKWREQQSSWVTADGSEKAADEYADDQTTEAQRNLNRAIDAETDLSKAKELLREWMDAGENRIIPNGLGSKTKSMIQP